MNTTLPIEVHCILRDTFEHPCIDLVQARCEKFKIPCVIRAYNSRKYSVDRDEIIILPAVHIFRKGLHVTTFYPMRDSLDSIDAIDQIVEFHHKSVAKKVSWKQTLFGWIKVQRQKQSPLTVTKPPKIVEFR